MLSRTNRVNGDELSILGFGCMRFATKKGTLDEEASIDLIRKCIDKGINYFDTAYFYNGGKSESILGKALAGGLRERVKIATKLPPFMVSSLTGAKKIFSTQLKRLMTDYIDYYLLHMLSDLSGFNRMKDLGVIDWLESLKEEGIVKNIGFSFHGSKTDFEQLITAYPWDFCQIQYNYMDVNNQAGISGLKLAHSLGIPVIVMEPLRGGRLADRLPKEVLDEFNSYKKDSTPVEWALRWIWNHPEVNVVLSGMNNEAQLEENTRIACNAYADSLTDEELAVFDRVMELMHAKTKIPCTGCAYCMPCPFGVNIPGCFSVYNDKYLLGEKRNRIIYLRTLGGLSNKPSFASMCRECGMCEKHCPQKIEIRKELKRVRREMEGPFLNIAMKVAKKFMKISTVSGTVPDTVPTVPAVPDTDSNRQGFNPYLPSWEYIPDGEPHVFGDRVYVYGSHDRFNGHVFCLNDYVCYSASIYNIREWKYEGVIYKKTDDPLNPDGRMCLYAPDVTQGPDGRYYLYYVLDKVSIVSVAVCDTPAGKYEFYGYVHYQDGSRLGEREGDQPQFDPGVLTEGDKTYLYTGFCAIGDKSRKGPMATVLGPDMLTIISEPVFIAPSEPYSKGSGYEGHEFFEAPSIRKIKDTYYFVYSSIAMHELCYATSKSPTEGFEYRGVIVSNNDLYIDTYKPADKPMYYGGNNHGGMAEINGKWYIFYHRHTNGTNYSRQSCIEEIRISDDGSIRQVEMTSCGPNSGPLRGYGEYPAYLACNLFCKYEARYTEDPWMDGRFPKITQDGKDGDEETGYIANMKDSATAGFKYFDCKDVKRIKIKVRGYCRGAFEVKTSWNGQVLGRIPVDFTNVWTEYEGAISIPDGIHALYFTYTGMGSASLASFSLE